MIETIFAGPLGALVIFALRIVDVSLATLRMLLTVRNVRTWVPVIGFFEALIWVVAIATAIQHLHSLWHLLGYAGGFAAGTMVGLRLEEKLAMGLATVRVICRDGGTEVAEGLRSHGFGVTEVQARGRDGPVEILLSIVKRRQIPEVIRAVDELDADAFVSVEEPRAILRGWMFPTRRK